jgi:predicted ATPase
MLWPLDPAESARPRLRTEIHRLKTALGPAAPILKVERDWLAIDREVAEVDVELDDSLGLVRGSWLPEESGTWFELKRTEIDEATAAGFEASARAALCDGQADEGLALVRRALSLVSERPSLIRLGMECLVALGDVPEALAFFDRYAARRDGDVDAGLAGFAGELRPKQAVKPKAAFESRLPVRQTEIFGREETIEQLVKRLSEAAGVVTLVGPGGVGKTTVALEVARRLEEPLKGNVAFAPLAAIDDVPGMEATIAQALPTAGVVAHSLHESLRGGEFLLVLDNFEQLPPDASRWLAELVARLPLLRVLVTSRRSVGIAAERCVPLRPFAATAVQGRTVALREAPTVSLFVDRVRRLTPEFVPDERELRAIAEIGNRLDGLPLAIVLVAARAASLGVLTVLGELERFASMPAATHDLEERHRDLGKTLDWSIRLLSPEARDALPHLTVFPRDWSVEGATEVLGQGVLDALPELVDQSLLVAENGPRGMRYRMWRLLREHLLRRHGPPSDALRERHADFCVAAVEAAQQEATDRFEEYQAAILSELANIDAAVAWTRERSPEEYERLLIGMSRFWVQTGHERRAAEWILEAARKAEPRRDLMTATLFQRAAGLLMLAGRYDEAEASIASAEAIQNELDSIEGRLDILFARVQLAYYHRADYRAMAEYAEQGFQLAEAAGLPQRAARFLANQAIGLTNIGEGEWALRAARRSIEVHRVQGSLHSELLGWLMIAGTMLALRRWDEAEPIYLSTLQRSQEAGLTDIEPHCRLHLTTVYLRTGRFAEAQESLARFSRSSLAEQSAFTRGVGHYLGTLMGNLQGNRSLSARSLDGLLAAWGTAASQPTVIPAIDLLAWALGLFGFPTEGKRLLDESDALREARGLPLSPHFSLTYEDARELLGPREEVAPPESIEALFSHARRALWLL